MLLHLSRPLLYIEAISDCPSGFGLYGFIYAFFLLRMMNTTTAAQAPRATTPTTIKTQAFVLSGAGGTTSASIVNLAVASPTGVKPVGNVIVLQKNNPRKSPK